MEVDGKSCVLTRVLNVPAKNNEIEGRVNARDPFFPRAKDARRNLDGDPSFVRLSVVNYYQLLLWLWLSPVIRYGSHTPPESRR